MKKVVRLSETKLRQIVKESVEKIVKTMRDKLGSQVDDLDDYELWDEFRDSYGEDKDVRDLFYDEDVDWDDLKDDGEWDGSWSGKGHRSQEEYLGNPYSEENIWRTYGNQNIHRDKPGREGMASIVAQGKKNSFDRRIARSLRPTNNDFENELYRDWDSDLEFDSPENVEYYKSKMNENRRRSRQMRNRTLRRK